MVNIEARRSRDARHFLAAFRQWLWFVALCTLLGAAISYGVSSVQAPVYRATTLLIVDQSTPGQDAYSSLLASDQLVTTYVSLVTQPTVLSTAAAQLGNTTAADLHGRVSASAQTGTQVISIQADDTSPKGAANIANAVAAAFISVQQKTADTEYTDAAQQLDKEIASTSNEIASLNSQIASIKAADPTDNRLPSLQAQLSSANTQLQSLQQTANQLTLQNLVSGNNVRVFQAAVTPTAPDHPKPLINGLAGAALGLALAIALAYLINFLDDRIRNIEQIELLTNLPTVGSVSAHTRSSGVLLGKPRSRLVESFRILRTNLSFLSLDRQLRTLVVTSAMPAEGKSTIAINLAISLAQSGKRVLLIDADMRRPTVHKRLGIENVGGLSLRLLNEGEPWAFATVPTVSNLRVLTAGPKPPNPTELLGSERMNDFIASLLATHDMRDQGSSFDMIIIDTPPALGFADAAVLAARAHGVIVVTRAGTSRERTLVRAVGALQRVNARIVGVVFNGVKENKKDDDGYYQYYRSGDSSAEMPAVSAGKQPVWTAATKASARDRWSE